MGTWGTALFSDDLARDLRDDFRELCGNGLTPEEATKRLIAEFQESVRDADEGPVFWLALAAVQWQTGRVVKSVSENALAAIDDGMDLKRWSADTSLLAKRRGVLQRLRDQLTSPPPPPRKLPRIRKQASEWEVGELVSYRLASNRLIVCRAIGHHEDKGGRTTICEMLDWIGTQIPSADNLARLPIKLGINGQHSQFMLCEPVGKQKGKGRLVRLGLKEKPLQTPQGYLVFPWAHLDRMLAELFGVN